MARKKKSRKEVLELTLRAMDMPSLIITTEEYGRNWTVSQYPLLRARVLEELAQIATTSNI